MRAACVTRPRNPLVSRPLGEWLSHFHGAGRTAELHRYRSFRLLLVLVALELTAAAATVAPTPPVASASPAVPAPDRFAVDLLTLMNEERAAAGLPSLTRAADADWVATARALDMASAGYLEHFNPAGVGAQRLLDESGVAYRLLGENIGRSSYPPETVVRVVHAALMASESHRANVLEPRFGRVGIGVVTTGAMYYFAVVLLD